MLCRWCVKLTKNINSFMLGNANVRISTLNIELAAHKQDIHDLKLSEKLKTTCMAAISKKSESIIRAMSIAYYLAKDNIASLKYSSLLDFVDCLGVGVSTMRVGGNATYLSRASVEEFQKDGFVTPATPDIPKTSCQYVDYSSSGHEDYKDTGFLGFSRSEETDDLQSLSYHSKADAQSQLSHQQEMKNPCKDDDGQDSIQQLMKDLIRESGCIIEQWSQVFSGSENFENFCLSRLDQLSEKAGTIEESLKQQKNKLCHRLRGLTNTLQEIEN